MDKEKTFQDIFKKLKKVMREYAPEMDCDEDQPHHYSLHTRYIMKNKKPLYFGAVKIGKNYVSFHLMPVYVFPELLTNISPELKRRMQGKSCFNFKSVGADLFDELKALSEKSYETYKDAGYINR
ncbi:MAG: hypothetical protein ACQ9MH_10340 [Nitrospinales bacterium]